jgi:hypothetical protein
MANLKCTQHGKVDLDYVLGIGGFDLERLCLTLNFLVSTYEYLIDTPPLPTKKDLIS